MGINNTYTLLKQHKNKKFNYKARFSKENETNANLETVSNDNEFISKWKRVRKKNVNRGGIVKGISMRMLIIILVLLLIGMYILDF